jgi:hypothetical protein
VICNYCGQDAIEAGIYNPAEDSPVIYFWHCQDCQHSWMSEDQEQSLKADYKKEG